ncbi:MAG: hypothetical protein V4467_04190 [Patescibacteria group bacterium]
MQTAGKYTGRVVSVPGNDGYAFIGIRTVAMSHGGPHNIETIADIFLHKDDCSSPPRVGMVVSFNVANDPKRGTGYYRAIGAVETIEIELIPAGTQAIPGFVALAPFAGGALATNEVQPTARQKAMGVKTIPPEVIAQVVANQPASEVPRDSSVPENVGELMRLFLEHLFPALAQFGSTFSLAEDDTALDAGVDEAIKNQSELGMDVQNNSLRAEVARFKSFRETLRFMITENLVRRDTILPIQYLPDLFTAVPVWYFWADEAGTREADQIWEVPDPKVHSSTKYFCNLFPNQNWADFFQMYNRRTRTLRHYGGDQIPPAISRRIREARGLFDYLVIMTPYHDVAGGDWKNTNWLRSIDPYVVGFKKGIPYMFVIGRFSDSGTFPLFNEMVADTIAFLRANQGGLVGFNAIDRPYWHIFHKPIAYDYNTNWAGRDLGNHLKKVAVNLIAAFDEGNLFDWLRGTPVPPATTE